MQVLVETLVGVLIFVNTKQGLGLTKKRAFIVNKYCK